MRPATWVPVEGPGRRRWRLVPIAPSRLDHVRLRLDKIAGRVFPADSERAVMIVSLVPGTFGLAYYLVEKFAPNSAWTALLALPWFAGAIAWGLLLSGSGAFLAAYMAIDFIRWINEPAAARWAKKGASK